MYDISFKERMLIASISSAIVYIICIPFHATDYAFGFTIGAFGYQCVDWLIWEIKNM